LKPRSTLLIATLLALIAFIGCGGDEDNPGETAAPPGTSIPIETPTIDVDGEMIIFRNTLESDAVASTLNHDRTFTFDFDPNVDSVISVDCARDGSRAVYALENNVSLESRLLTSDGTEFQVTGQLAGVAMSPDASLIAVSTYLPDNARGVLSLVDLDNGESSVIYNVAATIGPPAWSPGGESLVFHAQAGQNNQLFVLDIDSGEVRQLTDVAAGAFNPDWSPDGQVIAFSSVTENGNPQIFTTPASGGAVAQLTSTQTFKAEPRWSGDGSRIAYVGTILVPTASRLPARLHNVAVYTSARDGSDEVPFTDLTLDAWLLRWCRAGPWLSDGWTEQ
jgi:TolB protein